MMASRPTRSHRLGQRDHFSRCETFKVGYADYGQALDGAERLMEKGYVRPGCHITPYACDRCGEWHVANRIIVPLEPRRRP
jgi:hypothetical protein